MAESLSEAIGEGLKIGLQRRQVKAQERQTRTAEINAYTNALSERRQAAQAEAQVELSRKKQDLDQAKFDNEVGMQLLKGLSMKLNSSSPIDKQVFYTSDPGKAIVKEIKKRLGPGFVDEESGEPLLMSDKELFEAQMAQMNAQVSEKILNGAPLTAGEQNYATLIQSGPRGFLSDVFDTASKSAEWEFGDAQQRAQIFQQELNNALGAIRTATGAQPQQEQAAEPSLDEFLASFRRQ